MPACCKMRGRFFIQDLSHTFYAKRACCGGKLTVLKSVFIFLFCSLLTVVCHKAKDYCVTINIDAMNSRTPGVCAVV